MLDTIFSRLSLAPTLPPTYKSSIHGTASTPPQAWATPLHCSLLHSLSLLQTDERSPPLFPYTHPDQTLLPRLYYYYTTFGSFYDTSLASPNLTFSYLLFYSLTLKIPDSSYSLVFPYSAIHDVYIVSSDRQRRPAYSAPSSHSSLTPRLRRAAALHARPNLIRSLAQSMNSGAN